MPTERQLPGPAELLRAHGLEGIATEPLSHDGWSGAELFVLSRGGDRYVLKRDSLERNWIARETRDVLLREGRFAAADLPLPHAIWKPYLGVAEAGGEIFLLMPDLSAFLLAWERPVPSATLGRVLDSLATLHAHPWSRAFDALPWWCPLRERLLLLSPPAAERYAAAGLPPGDRFKAGWNSFRGQASNEAIDLVERLSNDPTPLLAALSRLPLTVLHGDFKLGNAGFAPDGRLALIDWQMTCLAPVAVELGWFLAVNSLALPAKPDDVLARYRSAVRTAAAARGRGQEVLGDWEAQIDLAVIVGLLLRGWRKGIDAEAGLQLASGVSAADDLAWWCWRAAGSAQRRL